MSLHIYNPVCPATSQALCTCHALSSILPTQTTKFSARLLLSASSASITDKVPPIVYLPSDLDRPVNELEFRSYLKVHKLQPPLNSDQSVRTTLPVDLSTFETRWLVRTSQRSAAPCWPSICSMCDKGPNIKDPLLCCHDCGLSTHSSCRGQFVDPKMFSQQYYLCESCTFCCFCNRKDNKQLTKICDTCTATWHVYCLQIPHSKVMPLLKTQSRYFRCKRCSEVTGTCSKPIENEIVQTATDQFSENTRADYQNVTMDVDSDDGTEESVESSSEDE